MSHPRLAILKTVRDIIKNGNTLLGDKVFINKMIHPEDKCLPQVIIYSNSESITLLDQAPKRQKRNMTMHLELLTRGQTEDQNTYELEQITWQIEILLADDDSWNGTVSKQNLIDQRFEFREQATIPIGHCQMVYDVEYITVLPESILTQQKANVTDLDAIQGNATDGFGWEIVGDPGAPQPGDPDNEVEAELLIEY